MRVKKQFSQHFLRDPEVVARMVNTISPKRHESVVEIGPGRGALTDALLARGAFIHAVEIDSELVSDLRERYFNCERFHIYEDDALKFNFLSLSCSAPARLVGNLPYNIATPLLLSFVRITRHFRDMHFCLQREFAQRLCSSPGEPYWSRLGATRALYCEAETLFDISPSSFKPRPEVYSSFVRLRALPAQLEGNVAKRMEELFTIIFMHKRKTIGKILSGKLERMELESIGVNPIARPETLSLVAMKTIRQLMDEKERNQV